VVVVVVAEAMVVAAVVAVVWGVCVCVGGVFFVCCWDKCHFLQAIDFLLSVSYTLVSPLAYTCGYTACCWSGPSAPTDTRSCKRLISTSCIAHTAACCRSEVRINGGTSQQGASWCDGGMKFCLFFISVCRSSLFLILVHEFVHVWCEVLSAVWCK